MLIGAAVTKIDLKRRVLIEGFDGASGVGRVHAAICIASPGAFALLAQTVARAGLSKFADATGTDSSFSTRPVTIECATGIGRVRRRSAGSSPRRGQPATQTASRCMRLLPWSCRPSRVSFLPGRCSWLWSSSRPPWLRWGPGRGQTGLGRPRECLTLFRTNVYRASPGFFAACRWPGARFAGSAIGGFGRHGVELRLRAGAGGSRPRERAGEGKYVVVVRKRRTRDQDSTPGE